MPPRREAENAPTISASDATPSDRDDEDRDAEHQRQHAGASFQRRSRPAARLYRVDDLECAAENQQPGEDQRGREGRDARHQYREDARHD